MINENENENKKKEKFKLFFFENNKNFSGLRVS